METAEQSSRFVISVLVPDRTGILRDITTALTDLGANIDQIRETVVEGYFTVTLTVTFQTPLDGDTVHEAIARQLGGGTASIVVLPFVPVTPPSAMSGGRRYVVTLTGRDRPGILKRLTTCLADKGINIEDWECHFAGNVVTYVGSLTVPPRLSIRQLQTELGAAMDDLGIRSTLQHENIFRATNEIGPIRSLLEESRHA
jgi:predicted amino acid-binding ACT domain protein